jgi:hypothetical protein
MSGYTRQDVSNNISNGSVIDADDLDLEFNSLDAAFNSSTGHTHDGTSGEGAPITVVGPAQDVVVTSGQAAPKSNNAYDLGSATNKWKDLYVDGVAYVDAINLGGTAVTATASELNTLDGITATVSELNILDGVTSTAAELNILDGATLTVTELNYVDGVTSAIQTQLDTLSSGKQPLDAGLTSIAGLTTSANQLIYTTGSDTYAVGSLTAAGRDLLDDATPAAQLVTLGLTATAAELNTLDGITASVSELNILDGVTSTAAELNILDGVTATAAELNVLDGITATVTELNYTDGVTSNIQTQLDTKASTTSPTISNPTLTGVPVAPTASLGTDTTQVATTAFVQAANKVVQVVASQTGTSSSTSSIIPDDNTVPQNTEGAEFLSQAITPTSATNILQIDVVLFGSISNNRNLVVALFQDSTAGALAAASTYQSSTGELVTVTFRHRMTAGTTSATTFKVRAGAGSATATLTVNGKFGGVAASSITITELTP